MGWVSGEYRSQGAKVLGLHLMSPSKGMHHLFTLFWFSFSIYLGQFPVFGDFRVDGRGLIVFLCPFFFLGFTCILHFCFVFRDIRLFPFPPSLFVALVGCGFLVGAVAFSTLDDPFIAL